MEHDPVPEGIALGFLADIAVDQGRVQDAVSPAENSYRIFRDLGDLLNIAFCVRSFARVLTLAGKPEAAARVLSSSTALMEEIGARPPGFARISRKTLAAIHTQLDDAAFAEAWEQGRALNADEAVALALETLS
jgi:hypothetical protein